MSAEALAPARARKKERGVVAAAIRSWRGPNQGFWGFLFVLPILLLFIALLIRSFINWLVEKDFWRLLRPNVLNDFQLDDIALLEHVTDDVVRDAVDQAGLDASKIVPPALGYQPKPNIRAI